MSCVASKGRPQCLQLFSSTVVRWRACSSADRSQRQPTAFQHLSNPMQDDNNKIISVKKKHGWFSCKRKIVYASKTRIQLYNLQVEGWLTVFITPRVIPCFGGRQRLQLPSLGTASRTTSADAIHAAVSGVQPDTIAPRLLQQCTIRCAAQNNWQAAACAKQCCASSDRNWFRRQCLSFSYTDYGPHDCCLLCRMTTQYHQ